MHQTRAGMVDGKILGSEDMGIGGDVGLGVNRVKVGDRVSVLATIACATTRSCDQG